MPQYLAGQEIRLWGFLKELSLEDNVTALLAKMAIYRQAGKLDETTLNLYTEYLLPLDLRAFQVAMRNLAQSPRQEGETAFPTLGDVLAAMDDVRERFPVFSEGAKEINATPVIANNDQKRLA